MNAAHRHVLRYPYMIRGMVLLIGLLLISCDNSQYASSGYKTKIVGTSYLLASIAKEIGGELVDVDWMIELGEPMLDIHLNSNQRARLMNAELIICDGSHSESWASDQFTSPEQQNRLLTLDTLPGARGRANSESGLLWLDPIVGREAAHQIAIQLASRDPDHGPTYHKAEDTFVTQINELLRDFPEHNASLPVIVLDGRWNVLLKRMGIESVRLDIDPLSMTDVEGYRINQVAKGKGIQYLILPLDTPPARNDEIRRLTHLNTILLDPVGLQSLSGHRSYVEIMRYNLQQLSEMNHSQPATQP